MDCFRSRWKAAFPFLVKIENAAFRRCVTAGETVEVEGRTVRGRPPLFAADCHAYAGGRLCAQAALSFVLQKQKNGNGVSICLRSWQRSLLSKRDSGIRHKGGKHARRIGSGFPGCCGYLHDAGRCFSNQAGYAAPRQYGKGDPRGSGRRRFAGIGADCSRFLHLPFIPYASFECRGMSV